MSQLPGFSTLQPRRTPRDPMFTQDGKITYPGGIIMASTGVDGSNTGYTYEIRAGWLVGKITASGKYVPCKRTKANGAGSTVADLVVDNAAAFAAGDTITVGSNTGCVIDSVNYSTNTITLTATKSWSDNDRVFAEDGSATCRGVLDTFIKLKNENNTAAADRSADMIVAGLVNDDFVLGDLSAILEDANSLQHLKLIRFEDNPVAAAGAFTNLTVSGTLGVTGAATLSSTLAVTTSVTTPLLLMTGTTGNQELRLTDNLADALSIKITSGNDLVVFKTTDSAEAVVFPNNIVAGSDATDRVTIKGIYMTPANVAVAVPSITDPDCARVQVDVSSAFSIQPAVGDVVIAIPQEALPSNARLSGAWVYQTDGVEITFSSEGGNVTGANKNFKFLVIDLT